MCDDFPWGAPAGEEEVILDVGEACIQTAARREHRKLVAALLEASAPAPPLEARAETLGRFLRSTDFAALRAAHPELAGGAGVRVRLSRTDGGPVRFEIMAAP